MRVADYIFSRLSELTTVRNCFFLSGGGAMYLNDALGLSVFNPIPLLHEQSVVIAANSSGRICNDIGVALITTGPGGTNAMTGIAGAWMESTPLIVLSGQVSRATFMFDEPVRQLGFQEINIVELVNPITKYAITILEPNEVRYHLEKAVYLAKSGRPGPVLLDIPVDVQGAEIDPNLLKSFDAPIENNIENIGIFESIYTQLLKAKRPLLIIGHGVRLCKTDMNKLLEFIEKTGIPFQTTWNSMDLVSDEHPLNMGRANSYGGRASNIIIQNSDFLLILGARLGIQHIGYNFEAFAREAYKIMVDVDEGEINKRTLKIDLPIIQDLKDFIPNFIKFIKSKKFIFNNENYIFWCNDVKNRFPVVDESYYEDKKYVDTYVLFEHLSKYSNEGDIIAPASSGTSFTAGHQAFKVKKNQRYLTWKGLAAMGYDLPAAIGACIESGNSKVITVAGDGGVQMNIQELSIVAGRKLPIKLFVMNNDGYLSIKATQRGYFNGHMIGSNSESGVYLPSIEKLAQAYDIKYIKLNNNSQLDDKLPIILNNNEPIICEVMVNPDKLPLPKLGSYKLKDGSMKSNPLEDLVPKISREELMSIMDIKLLEE